ncbi:calcium/calcium/calmodulin-dependent Serine/Threonine-kinase [Rhynchospora pubera]|uniref:Calcium/calcium/calmodulin-dependent Serine/Threonine-kinase n=1 Tax=Rhynchospora pubera TaxID=906938 RepID=A0AAV8FXU7_9POAL|nr:calcium/calcium/calmodulin-dependent Serine/Threonine-kinase [Rhynchospora pubera]
MPGYVSAVLPLVTIFVLFLNVRCEGQNGQSGVYISAVGDPGMRRDGLRVAWEAWNFCNEVGEEAPHMGSPRGADCFDLASNGDANYTVVHHVSEADNKLSYTDSFPGNNYTNPNNVDLYAAAKEIYLGEKCEVKDNPPWQFWMVMLKNGNLDTTAALCPKDGAKVGPFNPESRFPCFGKGCMNQPLVYHNFTSIKGNKLKGGISGSYDLDVDLSQSVGGDISYYSVTWEKEVGQGGWSFHHILKTSKKYPWLMLYLRSDATLGFSGGYHYDTRGMTRTIPESPNFKVRITVDVRQGGGKNSQFYLLDMGSCWKNSGHSCDGDVLTDVTRYSEMIINPETEAWCRPDRLYECPPYHTFKNGTRVSRNDTANFPYDAYHVYCSPGNAKHAEQPTTYCDPYSNPQPQEIMQILPHPVWGEYGYPTKKGDGWIGDPRTWELDVGGLSHNLYFYQDPGTTPARRRWTSLDVGTEIYVSNNELAEWILSDFDILVPAISSEHGDSTRLI